MRFGVVAVVGLMVAGVAAAQQASAPTVVAQQQKAIVLLEGMEARMQGLSCPGALTARQQATPWPMALWTAAFEDQSDKAELLARPRGLGVHVEFQGVKTKVTELELRVSYLPLRLRAMAVSPTLTNSVAVEPRERAKTFDLEREAGMQIGGDLLVGPAATITRVHLLSATFADGSVWHAPSEDACSIVPSPVMLVAER